MATFSKCSGMQIINSFRDDRNGPRFRNRFVFCIPSKREFDVSEDSIAQAEEGDAAAQTDNLSGERRSPVIALGAHQSCENARQKLSRGPQAGIRTVDGA